MLLYPIQTFMYYSYLYRGGLVGYKHVSLLYGDRSMGVVNGNYSLMKTSLYTSTSVQPIQIVQPYTKLMVR